MVFREWKNSINIRFIIRWEQGDFLISVGGLFEENCKSVCLTTLLGEEGSIGSIVHQSIDAMRYGIEGGNFTLLCNGNFVGSPHNTCVIPFCKKLPDDCFVMIQSIVNKVWSWRARLLHGLLMNKVVKMDSSLQKKVTAKMEVLGYQPI